MIACRRACARSASRATAVDSGAQETGRATLKRRRTTGLRRPRPLVTGFGLAGSLLVLFVALPLASTVLATPPDALIGTLAEAEVLASLGLTLYAAALATFLAWPVWRSSCWPFSLSAG